MGSCCSCFDAIRGGKHGNATDGGNKSTEMTSRNSASGVPPPTHGMSMAMSAPTIRIQGFNVSSACCYWCCFWLSCYKSYASILKQQNFMLPWTGLRIRLGPCQNTNWTRFSVLGMACQSPGTSACSFWRWRIRRCTNESRRGRGPKCNQVWCGYEKG